MSAIRWTPASDPDDESLPQRRRLRTHGDLVYEVALSIEIARKLEGRAGFLRRSHPSIWVADGRLFGFRDPLPDRRARALEVDGSLRTHRLRDGFHDLPCIGPDAFARIVEEACDRRDLRDVGGLTVAAAQAVGRVRYGPPLDAVFVASGTDPVLLSAAGRSCGRRLGARGWASISIGPRRRSLFGTSICACAIRTAPARSRGGGRPSARVSVSRSSIPAARTSARGSDAPGRWRRCTTRSASIRFASRCRGRRSRRCSPAAARWRKGSVRWAAPAATATASPAPCRRGAPSFGAWTRGWPPTPGRSRGRCLPSWRAPGRRGRRRTAPRCSSGTRSRRRPSPARPSSPAAEPAPSGPGPVPGRPPVRGRPLAGGGPACLPLPAAEALAVHAWRRRAGVDADVLLDEAEAVHRGGAVGPGSWALWFRPGAAARSARCIRRRRSGSRRRAGTPVWRRSTRRWSGWACASGFIRRRRPPTGFPRTCSRSPRTRRRARPMRRRWRSGWPPRRGIRRARAAGTRAPRAGRWAGSGSSSVAISRPRRSPALSVFPTSRPRELPLPAEAREVFVRQGADLCRDADRMSSMVIARGRGIELDDGYRSAWRAVGADPAPPVAPASPAAPERSR